MATAASRGLVTCHACGLLCRALAHEHAMSCPRCEARLHARKPHSLARTWALLITAYILYIPANLYPILEANSLLERQSSTIMGGVVLFWTSGSWFIAALIFIASIVVPLTKLLALTFLLISVHRRMSWRPHQRTQLYRLVAFIGRWSMLDIYVVALSVALVQVESVASMHAGLGAVAFGAVVVLTMIAAETFDPRLMWDAAKEQND
ncbi:paraquat-inducible protein A [Noviherbaspirillum humi]|uniref:Paraquat-inducible protein A n=1 Tax=Noviherbaspirillum humi TaxID=1688639 RepID=A0A239F760_9BURK|nr:paraquat-inducible protein A [Noviherbaspirillum humi]SNS52880.1 paraquat-inducible protein A [Noviherbaspirillum humi]